MRKILTLLIALMMAAMLTTAMAEEEPTKYTSGDYKYILLEDGTAEIINYNGKAKTLTIPSELDGRRVTVIGGYAFSWCDSLTSVTIPDSVTAIGTNPFPGCGSLTSIIVSPDQPILATIDGVLFEKATKTLVCYPCTLAATSYSIPQGIRTIGDDAFYQCESLTSITLPDSVTAIGDNAFNYCESLTSITLPDSVTAIGADLFFGCDSLTSIRVSPDHPTLATIDGVLFEKATKTLIHCPCAFSAQSYSIPQGIRVIRDCAFSDCRGLASVTIPDSVMTIGKRAFYYCYGLTSITIPDSVTAIGDYAFGYCANLTSITIPNSVTAIGERVFSNCESLTSVTLPDSVTAIGDYAFCNCTSLTSITLPDSVTSIGKHAFKGCSSVLILTVPRNSYARQYCIDNNLPYTYPDANDWLLN